MDEQKLSDQTPEQLAKQARTILKLHRSGLQSVLGTFMAIWPVKKISEETFSAITVPVQYGAFLGLMMAMETVFRMGDDVDETLGRDAAPAGDAQAPVENKVDDPQS